LRSIRLREHIEQSEEVSRWREEKFIVRMTERAWNLLLGWLQGGGLRSGSEDDDDSGRDRVLRIINERVQISGEFLEQLFR
jgi:transcription initiation factor TFIID subunit 5